MFVLCLSNYRAIPYWKKKKIKLFAVQSPKLRFVRDDILSSMNSDILSKGTQKSTCCVQNPCEGNNQLHRGKHNLNMENKIGFN